MDYFDPSHPPVLPLMSVPPSQEELETLLLVQASPTPSPESQAKEETFPVGQIQALMVLSGLVFVFLIYLFWKQRFREARFGVFATLLLAVLLPVVLILKTTTDWFQSPQLLDSEPSPTPSPVGKQEQPVDELEQQETPPPLSDSERIENAEEVTPEEEDRVSEGDVPTGERIEGETTEGDVPTGERIEGETTEGDVPTGETTEGETTGGDVPTGERIEGETTGGDVPTGETTEGDIATTTPSDLANPSVFRLGEPSQSNPSPPRETRRQAGETSPSADATLSPPSPSRERRNRPRLHGSPLEQPRHPSPTPPDLTFDLPEVVEFRAFLRSRDRGLDVVLLQKILQALNFYHGPIDGYFGFYTRLAVQAFQRENNLVADGIVGFSTCKILQAKRDTLTPPIEPATEIQCNN